VPHLETDLADLGGRDHQDSLRDPRPQPREERPHLRHLQGRGKGGEPWPDAALRSMGVVVSVRGSGVGLDLTLPSGPAKSSLYFSKEEKRTAIFGTMPMYTAVKPCMVTRQKLVQGSA
jgi:hypothetical protein